MLRARKSGVLTPCIFFVENDAATIFMERIEGQSVRDVLLSGNMTAAGMPASAPVHGPCQNVSMSHRATPALPRQLVAYCELIVLPIELQRLMDYCKRLDICWPPCMMLASFMET